MSTVARIPGTRTKIVCTVGPACCDRETLSSMAEAGMDVVRINSGHVGLEEIGRLTALVRGVAAECGRRVGVMLDLQGPRVRVGHVAGSQVDLKEGDRVTLTTRSGPGSADAIPVTYRGLAADLSPGDEVLVDGGLIKLRVEETSGEDIRCEVIQGGVLRQGKGMNFPGVGLGLPSFTERDRRYLEEGLSAGVDWVAQSFVRDASDIRELRDAIEGFGYDTPVMAKVERREAVDNLDGILEEAQGVMVARGDLGVEMDAEDVPLVQKELIRRALVAARPVVTATQMLESMVDNPRPTRAEASDVANAILDGTDAVMLSEETAVGNYPVKAVETMASITARTEQAIDHKRLLAERAGWPHQSVASAIGYAACGVASWLKAEAIVTITRTGYTARLIASHRPEARILAVSGDEAVVSGTTLLWGAEGLKAPISGDLKDTISTVVEACKEAGLIETGDLVVVTGGFLEEKVGTTNLLNVRTVD